MIRTPVCDLLDIEHPIALGGMGSVYSPELVAAVSSAGGLGAMGCHYMNPEQIRAGTAAIRERTSLGSDTTSWPRTIAEPAVGRSCVATIFTKVVLPAPFGPRRPKTVPRPTSRDTPSRARVPPR